MKTLLVTLEYPPFNGGVANYYANLGRYWPIGESFAVLDNSRNQLLAPASGFRIGPRWFRAIWNLRRKAFSWGADYILVGQILPLGTATYALSLLRPSWRYGVFLHGLDLTSAVRSSRKKFISNLILNRADKVICANHYVARLASESFPALDEDKIVIVNPGVASDAPFIKPEMIEAFRQECQLRAKTVLLTVGRLVRRKGVDKTIAALALLPPDVLANLVYVIAGTGPEENYLKKLVPPLLRDRVCFQGEISEEEKWKWLKACDIFIMPARHIAGDFEGFGIVYLEANICSKPVIAGQSGGVSDAVEDGRNGLLVDPDDPAAIAAAIARLAGDPEERARLGRQGRDRAIAEFKWEQQARKLVEVISKKL